MLEYFDQYQTAPMSSPLYQNAMRFYPAGQFEYDAAHDQLPTVSWILPTSYQSEHPDYMPAAGAEDAASLRVSRTITVGQLPWAVALSPNGATAYVADPDSDDVSVIDTASGSVSTVTIAGDPEALTLSPGGTTLWVGEGAGGAVAVVTTSSDAQIGKVELGFSGRQSGDGLEPTGMAFIG